MKLLKDCRLEIAGALLTASLVVGCEPLASETTLSDAADSDAPTADEVEREVLDAADTTHEFAKEKKEDYMRSLDEQLSQLDESIEKLKKKGDELAGDAKTRWEKSLAALEEKRQLYQQQYDELAESGDDAWQELKEGIEAAWKDLKQATADAAKQFDDASAQKNP